MNAAAVPDPVSTDEVIVALRSLQAAVLPADVRDALVAVVLSCGERPEHAEHQLHRTAPALVRVLARYDPGPMAVSPAVLRGEALTDGLVAGAVRLVVRTCLEPEHRGLLAELLLVVHRCLLAGQTLPPPLAHSFVTVVQRLADANAQQATAAAAAAIPLTAPSAPSAPSAEAGEAT